MGGYNFAQIAYLVGLYISNIFGMIVDPIQIRLNRDEAIFYIPNSDAPKCSSVQKMIIEVFNL